MGKEYAPEVKAAVMAALMDGQSLRQIEREHGVAKSTVAAWGKETDGIVVSVRDTLDKKKAQITELLVDLFLAKLESQISLAKHAGDRDWLKKQDASAVAMLLGVSDDKLIRLLEKYESNEPDAGTAQS
jgi:transposase-like protein